jgi:hypothetical protein
LAKHHRFFSISALIPPIFKAFLDLWRNAQQKWGPGSPQSQDLLVQGVMISNVSFWDHGSVWSLSHSPKK